MEAKKAGFIEALEEGKGYDYIANHYSEFKVWDLKDIILELLYEMGQHHENDVDSVIEELKERWED